MRISVQNNGFKKNLRVEKQLSVQPLPLTRPLHLPTVSAVNYRCMAFAVDNAFLFSLLVNKTINVLS